MAKHRKDDGSNSDSSSGSLKEITADDFKQQDARVSSRSRVWMSDMMTYPVHRNYNQDLYSFAWAQAVQNKPLGINVKPLKAEVDDDEDGIEMYVEESEGDSEKEEGELEEGEIELGSEPTNLELNVDSNEEVEMVENDLESEDKVDEIGEFDKRFGVILEDLETITVEEAESSFEEVCSRLQKCFASLKKMFLEGHGPILDVLVEQAFVGIQTVYSAFSAGNLMRMEHNKDYLLRLLIHIKNNYSQCLTLEQVKEIDVIVHALASQAVSIGKTTSIVNGPVYQAERPGISSDRLRIDPRSSYYIGSNIAKASPLLNLHEDYDEDSLPSPTRDNAPPMPVLKPIGFESAQPIAPKNSNTQNGTFHPYVTDAFKAVSTYQQKYGKNSILTSTRLPSPTPSEDGNDGDDDSHGEVSSASISGNARTVGPMSTVVNANNAFPHMPPVKTITPVGLDPNPVAKASTKSRDPRLRFMNSEVVNSRKHKAVDGPVVYEYNLKRQRSGPNGGGGWIEDTGMVASQANNNRVQPNKNIAVGSRNMVVGEVGSDRRLNANNNFNGSNGGSVPPMTNSTTPVTSLPTLLKDLAVNPTMLMHLVKMEQQRTEAEAQNKSANQAVNGLSGALSSALEVGQRPAAKLQILSQTISTNAQNDAGKIRMKPRDPRRILHSNLVQKSESLGSEPIKTSGIKDHLTDREQGEQEQTATLPFQIAPLPDISRQFTKNLQNLANLVSTSPQNSTQPIPSKTSNGTSQPISSKTSNGASQPIPIEQKTVPVFSSQGGTKDGAAQSANPWGDVDDLLDGYDDQEKAAIQKERMRRIAEQKKMFAARKLCLVLDLDHTLLNSAKFVEVDQVHEEILRKKEEQDKHKPERHLFRFPHMGMWTKLRPGVWNFLEKASELYELHLYTMGNKLYATEMAKILDPKGTLFSGRVISRGDDDESLDSDERVPKSKDLDGVLGMESAVVIIDDSVRVWPHNKPNLILVERYTFFPSSRRQFGLLGPSLLEIDHDERPEDGTLASSLAVIERIHQNFFSHHSLNKIDVRNILAAEQGKILSGCKVVFSRVFPVGEANPQHHPLWQTAEQFGAKCTNQIDEHVTHVVANSLGTDKVNWALSTGRFVVHPGWVEASALLYRRANEQDFAVK